jgi:uncharacterized protein (DUF488 family)
MRRGRILTIYTVGHSSRTLEELVALLRGQGIDTLVDIRRFPRSRTNPQFDADRLAPALASEGITYFAAPALGGRRGRKDASPAGDVGHATAAAAAAAAIARQSGWEVAAFRAYAAYATTPAFQHALATLVDLAGRSSGGSGCVIMCSEALWWRCHRRIVTDYLLIAGIRVRHILGKGEVQEASLTPFAQLSEEEAGKGVTLLYAPAERP